MSLNINEVCQLLEAIAQTEITELSLKTETFELTVRKGATSAIMPTSVTPPQPVTTSPSVSSPSPVPTSESEPVPSPASTVNRDKWLEITSPMVGTFYCAPAPGEDPFVEVGDRIRSGQVVCIIEAMKLMNEIEAEVSGQIMEILVENGDSVEYGQTLMWVNPDS